MPHHNPETEPESAVRSEVLESVKQTLLKQLPSELQEHWKDASIKQISEVLDARKEEGYEAFRGYHTSDIDLNVGDFLRPGSDGTIHYTASPDTLYGKKAKYLYTVEGSNTDQVNDEALGWHQSHAPLKIIAKIDLTQDTPETIGASFADVEYSG